MDCPTPSVSFGDVFLPRSCPVCGALGGGAVPGVRGPAPATAGPGAAGRRRLLPRPARLRRGRAGARRPAEVPQRPLVAPFPSPGNGPAGSARPARRRRHVGAHHRRPSPAAGLRPGRAPGPGPRPSPPRSLPTAPPPSAGQSPDRSAPRCPPRRTRVPPRPSVPTAGPPGRRRGHQRGHRGRRRPHPPNGWSRRGPRGGRRPHRAGTARGVAGPTLRTCGRVWVCG